MQEDLGRPILKEGKKFKVRVLRPSEYAILKEGSENQHQKNQLDALLYTGMRYVEMQRLFNSPSWLDNSGFVFLPAQASKKAMGVISVGKNKGKRRARTQLNRWVKLNSTGISAVSAYLAGKPLPTWETWTIWLKEWAVRSGLDPIGLGPKTTRKTWESWLTFYYGQNRLLEIVQSQGHTTGTSLHHYLSMPFLPRDKEQMIPYVQGMFQ